MVDLIGEPYLITWQADTLRLFRRSAGVFVQLDSVGSIKHGGAYPRPGFLPNGKVVYGIPGAASTAVAVVVSDYMGNDLSNVAAYNFAGGDASRRYDLIVCPRPTLSMGPYDDNREEAVFLTSTRLANVGSGSAMTTRDVWMSSYEPSGLNTNALHPGAYSPTDSGGHVEAKISPDGEFFSFVYDLGISIRELNLENLDGATTPWSTFRLQEAISGGCIAHSWSDDSSLVAVIADAAKALYLYSRTGTTFALEESVSFTETPISLSMFGPFIAVGLTYEDGSTKYRTRIYRRSGYELVPLTVLEDIGGDVLFTKTGDMLIDVVTKQAYARDGAIFTASHGAMTNIQAGTTIAALSPHVNTIYADGNFYVDVAADLVEDDVIDLNTLKFMLLDAGASFNPTHTTVSQVTNAGAYEVSGNNWPVGGVDMTTVVRTKLDNGLMISADNVNQEIFGGDITAHAGLIYSGTRPLIFLNYGSPRTIEQNSIAEVDFSSGFALVATA